MIKPPSEQPKLKDIISVKFTEEDQENVFNRELRVAIWNRKKFPDGNMFLEGAWCALQAIGAITQTQYGNIIAAYINCHHSLPGWKDKDDDIIIRHCGGKTDWGQITMSSLYVYDFGEEKYMVDDSGERWNEVEFLTDMKTVICESCFTEVTECLENEHGCYKCINCHDVVRLDLTESTDEILLDKGMGDFQVIRNLEEGCMEIIERHEDGDVIIMQYARPPFQEKSYSRWREITLSGTIYGYSYEGEAEYEEDDGLEDVAVPV